MEKIYTSATKIVFLMTAVTVSVSFVLGRIDVAQYMILATMVFGFYYGNKRTGNTKDETPSLG